MKVCAYRDANLQGCPELTEGTYCEKHRKQRRREQDRRRPNSRQRGYGKAWNQTRRDFLRAYGTCADCGGEATVPDHYPLSRKELIARGEPNPDAWQFLVPRCERCHNRRTAESQPGGFRA